MQVEPLSRHPHLAAEIAMLLNREWGHLLPWGDSSEVERRILGQIDDGQALFTLVALGERDALLGAASVKLFELPEHRDKKHWLGEVIVPASPRGKGVGSVLIRACISESRRLGLPALYLYTPDQQALYARLGWEEIESVVANGETVSIMCLPLTGGVA